MIDAIQLHPAILVLNFPVKGLFPSCWRHDDDSNHRYNENVRCPFLTFSLWIDIRILVGKIEVYNKQNNYKKVLSYSVGITSRGGANCRIFQSAQVGFWSVHNLDLHSISLLLLFVSVFANFFIPWCCFFSIEQGKSTLFWWEYHVIPRP